MNCLIPTTGNSKVIFLTRAKRSFFRSQCLGAGEKTGQGLKALAALARNPTSDPNTQDRVFQGVRHLLNIAGICIHAHIQ